MRAHHAALGNIEYALSSADDTLGCGCDYPGYVADTIVADSTAVVAQLRAAAATAAALPVNYDHVAWTSHFRDAWPPGTPAYRNYHDRIKHGTWLTPEQSARGSVTRNT